MGFNENDRERLRFLEASVRSAVWSIQVAGALWVWLGSDSGADSSPFECVCNCTSA